MAYSLDLRERVARACDEQRGTRAQMAELFHVSVSWVRRLLQRRRETGSLAPRPHAGGPAPKMDPDRCDRLLVLVTQQPDATLAELRDRLQAPVHSSTIARTLTRLGITVKKKVSQAAEQDRPDVRHKRAIWRGRVAKIDPARLVFLDETGAHTAMMRLFGRSPCGERAVGVVPQGHWRTTTLLAAVRRDGVVAPWVFEGATDALTFETWVEKVLAPAVRPGDIVVLDRLSAHQGGRVRRLLRKVGAGLWYLPPYSPEWNPIEKIWAKVKAWLRKAAARTTEALWEAIAQALDAVTADDCQHSFAHCGYPATTVCKML
jgi:transposase